MIGALFALSAYGLALVWGVMNVKNLAQGDFVIAGGYVSWWLAQHGLPPLLGVPVAFVVLWGIGYVVYRTVISRVIERRPVHLAAGHVRPRDHDRADPEPAVRLRHAERAVAVRHAVFLRRFHRRTDRQAARRADRGGSRRRRHRVHEDQPHGAGDPRHRAGRPRGPGARHRHREGLCLHLFAQRGDLRRSRGDYRDGLGHPAVLRDHPLGAFLRHRDRRRARQPAGSHRRRARHRRTGAIRRARLRHRLPAGDRGHAAPHRALRAPAAAAPVRKSLQ